MKNKIRITKDNFSNNLLANINTVLNTAGTRAGRAYMHGILADRREILEIIRQMILIQSEKGTVDWASFHFHELTDLLRGYNKAIHEFRQKIKNNADALELLNQELRRIDILLASRSALDDCPNRIAKIEKMLVALKNSSNANIAELLDQENKRIMQANTQLIEERDKFKSGNQLLIDELNTYKSNNLNLEGRIAHLCNDTGLAKDMIEYKRQATKAQREAEVLKSENDKLEAHLDSLQQQLDEREAECVEINSHREDHLNTLITTRDRLGASMLIIEKLHGTTIYPEPLSKTDAEHIVDALLQLEALHADIAFLLSHAPFGTSDPAEHGHPGSANLPIGEDNPPVSDPSSEISNLKSQIPLPLGGGTQRIPPPDLHLPY